jgi:hypothetical protein
MTDVEAERLGQQVVGDEKKELSKNFEDIWYIRTHAMYITIVVPFWF